MPVIAAVLNRARRTIAALWRELARFGVVGLLAFVIDLGGMNLLTHTVLESKVTTAKIISGVAATLFAWAGNRQWTFAHRRNLPMTHEMTLFFVINGIALAIAAAVLALSHYGLGFTSVAADNAATVLGIAIGTLFRFWSYRRFVFSLRDDSHPATDAAIVR